MTTSSPSLPSFTHLFKDAFFLIGKHKLFSAFYVLLSLLVSLYLFLYGSESEVVELGIVCIDFLFIGVIFPFQQTRFVLMLKKKLRLNTFERFGSWLITGLLFLLILLLASFFTLCLLFFLPSLILSLLSLSVLPLESDVFITGAVILMAIAVFVLSIVFSVSGLLPLYGTGPVKSLIISYRIMSGQFWLGCSRFFCILIMVSLSIAIEFFADSEIIHKIEFGTVFHIMLILLSAFVGLLYGYLAQLQSFDFIDRAEKLGVKIE